MKKSRLRIMLAVGGAFTLFACNAIIGTRDLTYDPDAVGDDKDGAVADDGSTGGDSALANDAPDDVGLTCPGAVLDTDPHNCGSCAHDCLGGNCMNSKCQPVKLSSASISTYALAVDNTNVYFSDINGGAIYTVAKDAAAPATAIKIADTPDPLIYDIVADANGVYFSWGSSASGSLGSLETILPDGGGRRALMADASIPRGLSLDTTNVYFALTYLSPVQIGSVARSAMNAKATTLSANEPGSDNTFVSGAFVYWGGQSKTNVRFCTTNPGGCSGTLQNFTTGLNASEALGGNTKNLFISGYDVLYQAAKGASVMNAALAAQNQPQVYSIASDDKDIYWIDLGTADNAFNDGSIRHCPIDATGAVQCTVTDGEIVVTSDQNPRIIVMDSKAVYWTVQDEGAVYRLVR